MRLARCLHSVVGLLAGGAVFDPGVLNSIKAASENIINGNRDATDAELLGLENLIDQLVPSEETPAAEESVPLDQNAASTAGGEQGSEVQASEAGGDSSSQGLESVTTVAPPKASSEAPAEPVEQFTEEPQPEPAGLAPHEELFAPQSHDEDDGA